MTDVAIQPMLWSETPDISEVAPFSDKDEECFREIRDVLKRYNALDRFGLTLIHHHFDVGEDEVMMEYTDAENRVQTVKPVKESDAENEDVTITHWKLADGDFPAMRTCVCARGDGHYGFHRNA